MAKEILVFNVTLIGQSTFFMQIRQLEFGLLQLTQQIDKLFNSLQFAIRGKLSIELCFTKYTEKCFFTFT